MKLALKDVRLAFPSLFEATDFENDGKFKFKATLLIPKGSPQDKAVAAAVKQVAKEKWGAKADSILESIKHIPNRAGYRDGDSREDMEGYAGNMFLNASSTARPLVVDRDRSPLGASDGRPYSGCYVAAIVHVYAYENKGKGIGFSLSGIQFVRDGDAFSGSAPATEDDFDDISDHGEDGDDLAD